MATINYDETEQGGRLPLFPADIPSSVSLQDLKRLHTQILDDLHGRGMTYDRMADLFEVPAGAALRQYHRRESTARRPGRHPKHHADVLSTMHRALINPSRALSSAIRPIHLSKYRALLSEQASDTIIYKIQTEEDTTNEIVEENLHAFSRIAHNLLNIDHKSSTNTLRNVIGKYYMYRFSSNISPRGKKDEELSGTVIKSFLEIGESKDHDLYIDFVHYHPDRLYFKDRGDKPWRSHGLGIHIDKNIFLIGNTEKGKALNIVALRPPGKIDFKAMFGYNWTSNFDGVLISARTVLIRDAAADKEGIRRMTIDQFRQDEKNFQYETLGDPPYICDSLQLMGST